MSNSKVQATFHPHDHTTCETCWMDSRRNGRCTNPGCDRFEEKA